MMRRAPLMRALVWVAAMSALAMPALAQVSHAPDTLRRNVPFLTRGDAAWALALGAATAAAFTVDRSVGEHERDNPTLLFRRLDDAAGAHLLPTATRPEVFLLGGLAYVYGRLADDDAVAGTAAHGMESVFISLALTGVLKVATGRAQPVSVGDSLSHDFSFGQGLGNAARQSFPSGHSAVAFSLATSVTEDIGRHWPRKAPYAAALLYGSATAVSLSRLNENHHWLSDIVFGAGMGALTGNAVSRYAAAHPHNLVDAILLAVRPVPQGDGRYGFGLVFEGGAGTLSPGR